METEVRLTTLERLEEFLALPIEAIGVGHEACPHKLPEADSLRRAAERVRSHRKEFVFVLPAAHERFHESLLERARHLATDGPTALVANDLGTLLSVSGGEAGRPTSITAGNGIAFVREQEPHLARGLEPQTTPEDDGGSLDLFLRLGASRIEVANHPGVHSRVSVLRSRGLRVHAHPTAVPVAYARACPTARHHDTGPPGCESLCDRPFLLSATHRWRLLFDSLEELSRASRAEAGELVVWGNVVYRTSPGWPEGDPAQTPDRMIHDVRFRR